MIEVRVRRLSAVRWMNSALRPASACLAASNTCRPMPSEKEPVSTTRTRSPNSSAASQAALKVPLCLPGNVRQTTSCPASTSF